MPLSSLPAINHKFSMPEVRSSKTAHNDSDPQFVQTKRLHRSRRGQPLSLRSSVMRHVVGFAVMFVYLAFVGFKADPEDGTLSNLTVVFFLIKCLFAYGIGYVLYTPVHRAWVDSKG